MIQLEKPIAEAAVILFGVAGIFALVLWSIHLGG